MFDVFFYMFFCIVFLVDFEWVWEYLRGFRTFCFFLRNHEYVKTSTACARELDFQGLEGFGSVYFCDFWGVGFGMSPGMDFE